MLVEVKIPSPGESVTVADVANWMVKDGDIVEKDQEIGEIESEKATLPLIAPISGKIHILVDAGNTVPIGTIVATIDTSYQELEKNEKDNKVTTNEGKSNSTIHDITSIQEPGKVFQGQAVEKTAIKKEAQDVEKVVITPLARKKMEEYGLKSNDVPKNMTRITRDEVENFVRQKSVFPSDSLQKSERTEKHIKMSALRKKLTERLVAVKNQTAMLTTFNEVDMSALIDIRERYQKAFTDKYQIKIGYMSFFTKAVTVALNDFPMVQAMINEEELIVPNYCDIGIAVQTEKGLMVPVVRNAHLMNIPELEVEIQKIAEKARHYKLSIDEMSGGTFTITNGGVFGSLLSTPLLNPPQSAILGMHSIVKRPVAVNDQIVIRPMMYLALSYDHRVIDGKESVGFLIKIKKLIENPLLLLTGGKSPEEVLLGID